MASKKISDLTALTSASGSDFIPIVDVSASETKKITVDNLITSNVADVLTTKGDVISYSGSDYVRVPVGSNDQVLTADSTVNAGVKWAGVTNNTDVLTTAGDIITYSGSSYYRLPVGSDDQVLTADSSLGAGVKWATASGGGAMTLLRSVRVPTAASGSIVLDGLSLGSYNKVILSIYGANTGTSGTQTLNMRFNNDTGSNYDWVVTISGTDSESSATTSMQVGEVQRSTTDWNQNEIVISHLPTNKMKTLVGIGGVGLQTHTAHGRWLNTSDAITRIDISTSANNWDVGSRFDLWGVT